VSILRRNNIVLNVKFHFAGELRGFANCVCVFRFVCRILRIWGILSENVCKQSRKTVNKTDQLCSLVTKYDLSFFCVEQMSVFGNEAVSLYFSVDAKRQNTHMHTHTISHTHNGQKTVKFLFRTHKYTVTNIFYFSHQNNEHSVHPELHTVAHTYSGLQNNRRITVYWLLCTVKPSALLLLRSERWSSDWKTVACVEAVCRSVIPHENKRFSAGKLCQKQRTVCSVLRKCVLELQCVCKAGIVCVVQQNWGCVSVTCCAHCVSSTRICV